MKRREFLKLAWQYGTRSERGLVISLVAAPVIVLLGLLAFWAYALFYGISRSELIYVSGSALFAALSWFLYQPVIAGSLSSPAILGAVLQADLASESEAAYIAEVIRFKEESEARGKVGESIARGYAHLLAYLGSCVGSLLVSLALYPSIGFAAPALLAVGAMCLGSVLWLSFTRALKREDREAERLGFHLQDLRSVIGPPGRKNASIGVKPK